MYLQTRNSDIFVLVFSQMLSAFAVARTLSRIPSLNPGFVTVPVLSFMYLVYNATSDLVSLSPKY